MFSARDKDGKIVNIKNVFNVNEQFCCLNENCTAKFIIKSPNSYKAKHFARLPSTQHVENCIYNMVSHVYNPDNVVKLSLEQILFRNKSNKNEEKTHSKRNNDTKNSKNFIISTPKQLFNYCLSNPLYTEYLNGKTINDIVVDARNIDKKYKGIQGIALVVGNIVYINSKKIVLRVMVHKDGTPNYLTATAFTSDKQIEEIKKYLEKSYNTKCFKGLPIAVFGNWKLDAKYRISSTITIKQNIIYRLKNK